MGFDPMNDFGKVPAGTGYNEQMNMGWYNAKVHQIEAKFYLGIFQNRKHNFFTQWPFKNPDFIIRLGRNTVSRAVNIFTFFPHITS
jgi:hypothetical protein